MLAEKESKVSLDADRRSRLSKHLQAFAELVDMQILGFLDPNAHPNGELVVRYTDNVEKAASDLSAPLWLSDVTR